MQTETMPKTLSAMSSRDLRLRLWVKEHLERARLRPKAPHESMNRTDAAIDLRVGSSLIGKWENPEKGSPTGDVLERVADWIAKRLEKDRPA